MFTGIVEELGTLTAITHHADSAVLTIRGPLVVSDATHGSSIACNGVCLTVVEHDDEQFSVDVMAETLKRSTLGSLRVGDPVNLERAMAASGRFGGHIVQGHVDGTGTVWSRTPGERWEVVRIGLPTALSRHVVEKGSITVDGVSLTVSGVGVEERGAGKLGAGDRGAGELADFFEVSLIPTTLQLTTLGSRKVGEPVNLEVDILAKYVERLLAGGALPHAGVQG